MTQDRRFHIRFHINDSGWRAIYADGFTVERLTSIVSALARIFPKQKALVGFDNRFLSREFANHVAWILEQNGWRSDLCSEVFPTPGVAKCVRSAGGVYDFGLMVTASHNPYYYNGLKILDRNGALIDRPLADRIESLASDLEGTEPTGFQVTRRNGRLRDVGDLSRRYVDEILSHVNAEAIRDARLKVCWDGFGGTTPPLFLEFFKRLGVSGEEVPMVREPTYGGRRLEPDETSLASLGELVRQTKSIVGIATDVDGDRFSVVDEDGRYVLNNALASLMVWYLLAVRGELGTVYQTVSCSRLTEKIAAAFGVSCETVPVGFLVMGRLMVEDSRSLVGIEETGGLAYAPHLPFKDGLMAHALVLEMLATLKKPLTTLIEEMFSNYGRVHYRRVDLRLDSLAEADPWLAPERWERTVGESVQSTSTIDGVKWFFPSGWLLIRRSKTEPLLRIYFESPDEDFVLRVAAVLEKARISP